MNFVEFQPSQSVRGHMKEARLITVIDGDGARLLSSLPAVMTSPLLPCAVPLITVGPVFTGKPPVHGIGGDKPNE